jgi:pimeloyl-[acyl-carrier protein] methyl ester esterase
MSLELIAMHGWAGDHRAWDPWGLAAASRSWSLQTGERGYGRQAVRTPHWQGEGGAVLVHSLGLHLLPAEVWGQTRAVVLLASFGAFVPPGASGRRTRAALQAMASRIEQGDLPSLLDNFLTRAAAPAPLNQLPPGVAQEGSEPAGVTRLLEDLALLGRCDGLPAAFPAAVPVLLVEAGADQIVPAASQELLRQALPQAVVWSLEGIGHSLLGTPLIEPVLDWLALALAEPRQNQERAPSPPTHG